MPFFSKSSAVKKSWDPNSGETLTWKRQLPAGPVKQKTEVLLNVQPSERSASDPLSLSPKQTLPEPTATTSQPFIPTTVQNPLPSRRPMGPSGQISQPLKQDSSSIIAKAKDPNHAHLFRRYESQNSIPVSKLPLGASGIDKNNLQKFALQMEKVTKSSTIPDMLNIHVAPAGDQKKPRFRTDKAPLQPAKFGHMQRILLPRGDSQKTLDVNSQNEPSTLNVNRKNGGDGSHSDGEFPDSFKKDTKFEDTVSAKAENQLDQLWASHARNLALKPPRFTISRKASMASSLSRPPAAHSSRTVPQAAPAGDTLQRRSHEPSWWDK
ncbi:hypothetical protein RvY_01202-2 [Ramazzottius varieornatus]|uniref:Uncharacterized protein n=1 Tax=Ramazzottius varieornatus TaxID=947166 RepID=A0A1D1UFU8_RAMVA|nr:hypothetical protein RvY_01202-2 [Ramazzottius varieornatus]